MSSLLASDSSGFQSPSAGDFWQPFVGSGQYVLTRPMVVMAISLLLISVWLLMATRRLSVVPGKLQWATEGVYGMIRNGVARDVLGSHDFLRFVPLLFTMFVLILVNNLFGIVPFIQFPTMSRIGFPIGLALVVFVVYHVVGIKSMGLGGYFKHMVPAGLPGWIVPLIFFLELVTYFFTRPVTLALRLFGNMFAGHILLLLVFTFGGEFLLLHSTVPNKAAGVLSFAVAVFMHAFEGLIEFLQAYIFTLLAAVYIAGAVADEH